MPQHSYGLEKRVIETRFCALGSGMLSNPRIGLFVSLAIALSDVTIEKGPPAALTITYTYLARYGPQGVSVMLPVPAGCMTRAREVEKRQV